MGRDQGDAAGPIVLGAGRYRFAVGRDASLSAGDAGTYTYAVTTDGPVLVPGGQTVNDQAPLLTATSCP